MPVGTVVRALYLDAFVQRDAVLAREVCTRDDEVDSLYKCRRKHPYFL